MPKSITIERFDYGLDLRKGASTSDANRLRVNKNAYTSVGRTIKKRPGTIKFNTLEPGTLGLFPGGGKINTLYGGNTIITHANPLFMAHNAKHKTNPGFSLVAVHFGDMFNGFFYAVTEYNNGDIQHNYFDYPANWAENTTPALGTFRLSTINNGFKYEVTAAGTTHATNEPIWPTTPGATIVDGTVTWTCRTYAVLDANCPNTKQVLKLSSKIWAIGVSGDTVRFSATNDPRDWTTANDAGFLPVGVQQSGTTVATALGFYTNRLVVFFSDSSQVWQVDVDPAKHAFLQSVDVGTVLSYSHSNMSGDVFFLSPSGVRTITRQDVTTNLIDSDVGSPIDNELIDGLLIDIVNAKSQHYRGAGQYWLFSGQKAAVFTFSRTTGISSWSIYEFPYLMNAMAELNAELYIRSGNDVYKFDRTVKTDDGVFYHCDVELSYLDFKSPGILKQILGMDAVVDGTCNISFRFDPREPNLKSDPPVTVIGDTRSRYVYPVELVTTSIAPVIDNFDDQDFELHQLIFYFENLGIQ